MAHLDLHPHGHGCWEHIGVGTILMCVSHCICSCALGHVTQHGCLSSNPGGLACVIQLPDPTGQLMPCVRNKHVLLAKDPQMNVFAMP
jgi:hypothetical protein